MLLWLTVLQSLGVALAVFAQFGINLAGVYWFATAPSNPSCADTAPRLWKMQLSIVILMTTHLSWLLCTLYLAIRQTARRGDLGVCCAVMCLCLPWAAIKEAVCSLACVLVCFI